MYMMGRYDEVISEKYICVYVHEQQFNTSYELSERNKYISYI